MRITMRGTPAKFQYPTTPSINLIKLQAFHMGAAEIAITIKKYIQAKSLWKY